MKWIQGLHFTVSPETAAMLASRRRELGLSLRQAGKACGCSHEMIRQLELGRIAPKIYLAEGIIKGYRLTGEAAQLLMHDAVPSGLIFDRLKRGDSRMENTVVHRAKPGIIIDQNLTTGEWSARKLKGKKKAAGS